MILRFYANLISNIGYGFGFQQNRKAPPFNEVASAYTWLLGIRGFGGWCGFCHELFVAVYAYVSVFWVVASEAGYGGVALFTFIYHFMYCSFRFNIY